jgi:hypothetical protein
MQRIKLLILSLFVSTLAYGDAVIFNGDYVKTLKDKLHLQDTADITTGTADPSSVATSAPKGSLYLQQGATGKVYVKLDTGSSTNWSPVALTAGVMTANRALQTDASGNTIVSSTVSDTELGYLDGVSSSIQTQLNAKAATASSLAQFAPTTSLELKTLLTDETGSGAAVFGTTPTFTTSLITPLVQGGTSTTSPLTYKTTSGVGDTGADHIFQVGNNGGTEAMRILNNGNVGVGITSPSASLEANGIIKSDRAGSPSQNLQLSGGDVGGISLTATSGDSNGKPFLIDSVYTGSLFDNSIHFRNGLSGSQSTKMIIDNSGNVGIGTTVPTASLHIKAGTATANTAPLKLTSGTNLTTPELGAVEYDGTNLFYTASGPTRHTIANLDEAQTFSGQKTFVAPILGTPSSGVATNLTGTASGLTAGNVTTNANLTGHVTSTGNAAVLGSFTSANLSTALTDESGSGVAVFATSPSLVTPTTTPIIHDGQASAPSTPAAGYHTSYVADSDNQLHMVGPDGNDRLVNNDSRNYMYAWFDGDKAIGTVTDSIGDIVDTSDRTANKTTWATSASADLTVTNSTSSPLRQVSSIVLDSVSTGSAFLESPLFTIDSLDLGKPIAVSLDVSGIVTSDDWQVYVARYDTNDVLKERIVIAGTASASSPYSARPPPGTASFNGFFISGSTSTDQYSLRFARNSSSDTTDIKIDSLYVGPQNVVQGAAVTDWVTYTPTTPTGVTLGNGTYTGVWRRVGDSIQVRQKLLWGSTTSMTTPQFQGTLNGNTVDTSKLIVTGERTEFGTASCYDASADIFYTSTMRVDSSGAIYITSTEPSISVVSSTTPFTFANTDVISVDFTVPISTWQSSLTLANRAVEEYSSDDGSSDVFGINGSLFPNQAAAVATTIRDFTFQGSITATDKYTLEISEATGYPWSSASDIYPFSSGNNAGSTNFYGVRGHWLSATVYRVEFGNQGERVSSSAVTAGNVPWSTFFTAGARFRVRKVSGGSSVGFPVGARNIVGDTTGTTVPTGYLGELVTADGSAQSLTTGQYNDGGVAVQTLGIGIWDVQIVANVIPTNASTSVTAVVVGLGTATGNSGTGLSDGITAATSRFAAVVPGNSAAMTFISPTVRLILAAPTTYYAKVLANFTVSTATGTCYFRARRVG